MTAVDVGVQTSGRGQCSEDADVLEFSRWKDPIVERVGYDACGDYVELFWLPIIGPTSTWLLRRLAILAVLHPGGFTVDGPDTAQSLGLGPDAGPRSSFAKSLQRLSIFGLIRSDANHYAVRTVVPPLTMKHLARLPEHLQSAHSLWAESDPTTAYSLAFAGVPQPCRTPEGPLCDAEFSASAS